jgi:ribosomal protein L29
MKARDIREWQAEELTQHLRETALELRSLQLKHRTGEGADKPLRIRTLRRDVARMLTVQRERKAGT